MSKKRAKTPVRIDSDLEQLRAGEKLKEIHVYPSGRACKIEPRAWKHIYTEAKKTKQWAEKHEYANDPDSWPASGMSIEHLKDSLLSSVEEMALKSYRYLHYRAHAKSTAWGSATPTDPAAKRDWEKITGKKIKEDC
jgi:hypothetical protein